MEMSELKSKLDRMKRVMSQYYTDPEFHGEKMLFDVESKTTCFYRGLLNVILGLELLRVDLRDERYSVLDLIDLAGETAVVITPSATPNKRKHTLRRLEEHMLRKLEEEDTEQPIKRLIFLSTHEERQIMKQYYDDTVQASVELWGIDFLTERAEAVSEDKQRVLMGYLDDWIENDCPLYALKSLPPPCDHFIPRSRDKELGKLIRLLKQRQPVFVTGDGGIGKTQTVIQLALRAAPRRGAYMIRFAEPEKDEGDLLRNTIMNANFLGYRFEGEDDAEKNREYEDRMEMLEKQYAGAMLVLDNLDFKRKGLDEICCGSTFDRLKNMGLQLVITSRSKAHNEFGVPIEALKREDCLKLMLRVIGDEECEEYSHEELYELIDYVEGHTLTVFLIGKMLAGGWFSGETPKSILDTLKAGRIEDMDSFPEVVTDKDQTYESATIYSHLRSLFGISGLSGNESSVMRFMALLPEGGFNERLFLCGLNQSQCWSLKMLTEQGLIQKTPPLLKLHPMIRMICKNELKPTGGNCRKFLQMIRASNDPATIIAKEEVEQLAKLFSDVSDQEDPDGRWARVAALYWTTNGNNEKALKYNQRALDRSGSIMDQQDIVTALNQMGNAYYNSGNADKAMEYQQKALAYQEKIPADELRMAYTYNDLGNIYGSQRAYEEALNYHLRALEIAKNALRKSPKEAVRDKITLDLAKYYTNVGLSYYALGRTELALENLQEALDTFEEDLLDKHPDVARTYNGIGMVYDSLGDHEQALTYRRRALHIVEKALPADHPELARVYSNIGNTFFKLKIYDQALKYQFRGLDIREKTMPSDNPDLALSYANISATYRAQQDHVNALEFQKKALEIRKRILPKDHILLGRCYKNMSISCEALGMQKEALSYLEQAVEIMQSYPEGDEGQIQTMKKKIEELYAYLNGQV